MKKLTKLFNSASCIVHSALKSRFMVMLVAMLTLSVTNVWGVKYKLVTSTSDLVAGSNYIIGSAKTGSSVFIATTENTNNRKQSASASITAADSTVTLANDMLVLQLGGSEGAWTLKTTNYAGTDGYLASASSGNNNHCRVISTSTTGTISFSDGAVVINLNPHTSRTLLRYNSSSSCFACYSSGQNAVYLYKEVLSKTAVTLNANEHGTADGSVTYTSGNTTPDATPAWVSPSSSDYTLTGYYTAATDGVKVINADNSLNTAATDYVDANGKWKYAESTLTLYAQWQSASTPQIVVTPTSFSPFTYKEGEGPSDSVAFTVNGLNMTGYILVVSSSQNYEFSYGEGWKSVVIFKQVEAPYVQFDMRLKAGLAMGDYNDTLKVVSYSGEAPTVEIPLTGSVTIEISGDTLTRASTGVSSGATTYSTWSDKTGSQGVAKYAGSSAGSNNSIQLRKDNNSGIVSTTSAGKITAVKVDWESHTTTGRSLEIYGSNVAYTGASDLYGDNKGTLLGTISKDDGQEQLLISGKYKYVGVKAIGGALYLNRVIFAWVESTDPEIIVTPHSYHFEALDNATDSKKFGIAKAYLTGEMSAEIIDDADSKFSAAAIANDSVVVTFTPAGGIGNFSAKLVVKSMKSEVVEASDTVALTGEGIDSNVPVTGVTVNKQELTLEKGATETLSAVVAPENASDKTITWSSDNTEVATVDATTGEVTALKKGTANIIAASNNNIKDTCVLTVVLPQLWEKVVEAKTDWTGEYLLVYEDNNTAYVWTGISDAQCYVTAEITNDEITKPAGVVTLKIDSMTGGCSLQIKGGTNNNKYIYGTSGSNALNYSDNASVNTLEFVSGDNSTILITSNTSVFRYNPSSKYFRYYKSTTYTGQKAVQLYEKASTEPSVKLNKKSTSLSVGAKETLTAKVKNSEATVVWSTLNDQVATVNNGEITAVAVGETKIIATITEASVNYADTCVVTVTPAATVTSVTIAPQDTTLYIYGTTPTKQSATFTATVVGENEPAQTVTWSSLNDEVATVTAEGLVKAVAAGTAKIVAISTVDDTKTDTAEVTVKVVENTQETAYTTAEAIDLYNALTTKIKDINVYVKGIVSLVDDIDDDGAMIYWLDNNAFEIYKGKSFGGAEFYDTSEMKANDSVVVMGKLSKYGSYYELASGSTLIFRKTAAVLAWSATTYSAELGQSSYDYPTLTKTPSNIENVTYESSNPAAATIDPTTGVIALAAEGTTTIKASFAGNDTLFAAEATYTLTVAAEVKKYTITYNTNGGSAIAAVPEQTNLPATFPTPTKEFKVFGGWYLDNDVFEAPAVANMPLTKDTTLYAKWDEPKSITEMLAMIPESGNEVDNVYGWGYIKAGASVSSGYAYYYITDGSGNDFYIYKGLNVNGESFTSADQLPSGNKVMIFGTIKNYKGTPEFDQGSRIINNAAVTVPVTGVSLNKEVAEVKEGKTITLKATIAPSHASNQNVTWSSNKESIATVEEGVVTGVAAGEALIIVETEDGHFKDTCVVTVVTPPTFDNGVWVKVAATSELNKNDYYIIATAYKDYSYAMKSYTSGNNCGGEAITKKGELLTYTTQPAIFQLEDGNVTDQYAIKDIATEKYLYASGGTSNNQLKAKDTKNANDASWTIAITEGTAAITASLTGSNARNKMSWNNSSTLFACYSSVQTNGSLALYKYVDQYEAARTGLSVGQIGTICQGKSILAVRGGAFYNVEFGTTAQITFKEITEFPIAAGTPAVFQAEAATLEVIYGSKTATEAVDDDKDGLVGLVSGERVAIEEGNILVSGGRLRLVGDDCWLTAGHAYIDMSEVSEQQPTNPAPGRRLVLTSDEAHTPTALDVLKAMENAPAKVMMNGQVYILRDGKLFNAQGQIVK